jgi:hypothetical protein
MCVDTVFSLITSRLAISPERWPSARKRSISSSRFVNFDVTAEGSGTNGGWIIAMNGDRTSFGGNAKADDDGNVTGQEEYQDHGPAWTATACK